MAITRLVAGWFSAKMHHYFLNQLFFVRNLYSEKNVPSQNHLHINGSVNHAYKSPPLHCDSGHLQTRRAVFSDQISTGCVVGKVKLKHFVYQEWRSPRHCMRVTRKNDVFKVGFPKFVVFRKSNKLRYKARAHNDSHQKPDGHQKNKNF